MTGINVKEMIVSVLLHLFARLAALALVLAAEEQRPFTFSRNTFNSLTTFDPLHKAAKDKVGVGELSEWSRKGSRTPSKSQEFFIDVRYNSQG